MTRTYREVRFTPKADINWRPCNRGLHSQPMAT